MAGGVALAMLDNLLQQQGQPPLLSLAALPGLAVITSGVGRVVAALIQYIKRSPQHLEQLAQIKEIP